MEGAPQVPPFPSWEARVQVLTLVVSGQHQTHMPKHCKYKTGFWGNFIAVVVVIPLLSCLFYIQVQKYIDPLNFSAFF